jgi:aminoglycoside phosphotransferase (APT) family kinase protein
MIERIEAYLQHRMPVAREVRVENLVRIPGGASRETWSFDARWTEDGEPRSAGFIIRRDPDASLLQTERDVEYRVMAAVQGAVPAPPVYWLETDGRWLDRPFFVMGRIDGCEASPSRILMNPAYFAGRERLAQQFVEILARIHAFDWRAAGLAELGAPPGPDACAETEIAKWAGVIDREALEPQPVLRAALEWLRQRPPPPALKLVLVHADYRTGNFLAQPDGEIKAVLDWEMAHIGDPLEDVAWACIRPWRWLGNELIGGLMERERFYRLYEEASGNRVDPEAVRFWEILGNVKLAAIFLTGARSFCEGRTHSPMMAFLGRNIGRLELEIMDLMGV